ncbi:MAG TPA: hypothetical protein VFH68_18715 [Polyangia bacterium]|nr:hypothetical protein [Polyangia bacterium]
MAVTGCHRSLNQAARDAAAGDADVAGDGIGGGSGPGAGGRTGGAGGSGGGLRGAGGDVGGSGGGVGGSGAGGQRSGDAGRPDADPDAGPGDGGRGGPDSGNEVTYSACTYLGNLDHLTITKRDAGRNLCVVLSLFSPVQNPTTLGILLPPSWAVQQAAALPMIAGVCQASSGLGATSGSGAVGINGSLFTTPPATVDIDVYLVFPPAGGNQRPPERLNALGLQTGSGC